MTALQERLSSFPRTRPTKPLVRPLKSFGSASDRLPVKLLERHEGSASSPNLPIATTLATRPRSVTLSDVTIRPRVPKPSHVPTLAKQRRFPVAALDFSKKDVGLPYGAPRMVTARTLKELAGGKRTDQLLKNTRSGWEFVPDSTLIDLSDGSVVYKVAGLTIFS